MNLKIAIVLCLTIGAVVAVDYCNDMRCKKKPHVACNTPAANGGFGPACSPDREAVNITPELQQRILDIHNELRNQQAAGETPNYGPASRMGTLVWDDGLAEMAGYNARLCIYDHDPCRNTEKYYPAGQNIAQGGNMVDDNEIVEKLTRAWFDMEAQNGYLYGWMDMINNFQGIGTSHDPRVEIGHFTQFITQDAMVVGCAGSKYTDSEGKQAQLVCNYGFGNMPGEYLYEAGPPASKCKTGPNPDYPALCSVDEDYSEDVARRSGWSLKPTSVENNQVHFNYPEGCEDDPKCREILADPNKYWNQFLPKKDTTPKVKIVNGRISFQFPSTKDCNSACQNKFVQDYMASHPELGK